MGSVFAPLVEPLALAGGEQGLSSLMVQDLGLGFGFLCPLEPVNGDQGCAPLVEPPRVGGRRAGVVDLQVEAQRDGWLAAGGGHDLGESRGVHAVAGHEHIHRQLWRRGCCRGPLQAQSACGSACSAPTESCLMGYLRADCGPLITTLLLSYISKSMHKNKVVTKLSVLRRRIRAAKRDGGAAWD